MEESKWVSPIPGTIIDAIIECDAKLLVKCHTTATSARGPSCGFASTHVHSYRTRHVLDRPSGENGVEFEVHIRHFRCANPNCPCKTFAERIPPQVAVRARRTSRLNRSLRVIGLLLGGEPGPRLCQKIQMPVSSDTRLRVLRQEQPSATTPRGLGVDDWAWRRGQRSGTLLVDLETHRPIDLLADRTAESLAAWLQQHPGIRIITRDRSGEYARGIRVGAPHAKQGADRWHLVHTLHAVLERLLQRKRSALGRLAPQSTREKRLRFSASDRSLHRWVGDELMRQAAHTRRSAREQTVKVLQTKGCNIQQIARTLKVGWKTVRQFYRAATYPTTKSPRRRVSLLDPYVGYLQQRCAAGCHNAMQLCHNPMQLWREIRAAGYRGSHHMLMRWTQLRRDPAERHPGRSLQVAPRSTQASTRTARPTSPQLGWLLLRPLPALETATTVAPTPPTRSTHRQGVSARAALSAEEAATCISASERLAGALQERWC